MLYVYLNNDYIGTFSRNQLAGGEFCYDKNAKKALSLSLPLRDEKYDNDECMGYFNGLLPESDHARQFIAKKYGTSAYNDFSLLKILGYDCPGAISFFEEKREDLKEYHDLKGEYISEGDLETYIKELPQKPLGTGAKDLRLSLAGAQDKTAVVLIDDKIYLPDKMTPTTHILKPAMKDFKQTVENEYICLKAAQKMGIDVPEVQIRYAGDTKYFLIERYDRIIQNGRIKRLHQEDFCQALNIRSANKYQEDGGVGFKNCFDIIAKTTDFPSNMMKFLDIMCFNFLLINNDAHGKNFSLIYRGDEIELAPAYDIMCTKVYSKLTYKMAMNIGGYYDCEGVLPVHFDKMARECDISYPQLRRKILNMADTLPDIIEETSKTIENTIGSLILQTVSKHCRKVKEMFKKSA